MFDVSPLVPEAHPIVLEAAQIFYKHLHPWLTGMLVHGSAYKGGFIPNCSDIDIQLYLKAEAFDQEEAIPLKLAIAIHRELAHIDVAPFQYIQSYTLPDNPTKLLEKQQRIGPIPGAYHMVFGTLPIPEATIAQIIESAKWTLERQRSARADVSLDLFQHGGGKLERRVRFLCTDVWPTLYSILTLRTQNPLYIWQQCKENVIDLLPEHEPLGQAIRAFYNSVYTYYTVEQSVEQALLVLEQGVHFSQLATEWYQLEVECG
jgi:hypothetical protein